MLTSDAQRLDAYFRKLFECSRVNMPRALKTPEAVQLLEEFEESISVLVDRYALRLVNRTQTQSSAGIQSNVTNYSETNS